MPALDNDTEDMFNDAVSAIGEGLGFEDEDKDNEELVVEPPKEESAPAAVAETASTPAAASESAAPAPAAAPPAPETLDPATAPPPTTWRKEASAAWAALPSEVKGEILKREADIFKGIEGYKKDATLGQGVKHILAPYEQIMQQSGVNPLQHISGLLQAHHILATGSQEQRLAFFQKLAQDYRIAIPTQQQVADPADAPYVDPTVLALRQDLEAVQSRLARADQERQLALVNENRKQVDTFASDPKNQYFNEVADDMVLLLNKGLATTLQQAYDEAVWRNPVTRAKELARQTAAAAPPPTPVVTQVAKARAATAANVKTSAKSGGAATPLGSFDDTLRETLATINART